MPILKIQAKCSDMCSASFLDMEQDYVQNSDGYVPEIPWLGGGDYVEISINLTTGKVINFDQMSDPQEVLYAVRKAL